MHKYDILAISYAYTPYNWPRSIQVARLLEMAAQNGKKICLITNEINKNDKRIDQSLINYGYHENIKVIRLRLPWYFKILKIIPFMNKIPDTELLWSISAALKIRLKKNKYTAKNLVTFSNPLSDHLFGLLNRNFFCNWIAHFSDPWSLNIFRGGGALTRFLNSKLEQTVFEKATSIVFVSKQTSDMYKSAYNNIFDKKFKVIHHIKNEEILSTISDKRSINFLHVGSLYGNRSPSVIFDVIANLKNSFTKKKDKKVIFNFFGETELKYEKKIEELGIQNFVKFHGSVGYFDALALMSKANCLVLIDADSNEGNVFIASKLVDYWSFPKTPILALTPRGSASDELLSQYGQKTFEHFCSKNLLKFVMNIVDGNLEDFSRSNDWINVFSKKDAWMRFETLLR